MTTYFVELAYGAALNEGRGLFPVGDNVRFSGWLSTNNLSVANDADQSAAMWAAANPDQFIEARAAQERGEITTGRKGNAGRSTEERPATAAEIGLSRKDIHEAGRFMLRLCRVE